MAEYNPPSPDFIRQLHLFSQVPEIYRPETNEELSESIKADAEDLALIDPPLTHSDIGEAIEELDHHLREVMRCSEFGTQFQKDYGYTEEDFPPLPDFPIIVTRHNKAWLNAVHSAEGVWDLTNMQTGRRIQIHRSLFPLIQSVGYYGSHEDRATPQEIAYTIDIRCAPLAEDDPILEMIGALEKGNAPFVTIRTFDQMERYLNIKRLVPHALRGHYRLRPATLEEAEAIQITFGKPYFLDVLALARGDYVLSNLPLHKNDGPL